MEPQFVYLCVETARRRLAADVGGENRTNVVTAMVKLMDDRRLLCAGWKSCSQDSGASEGGDGWPRPLL